MFRTLAALLVCTSLLAGCSDGPKDDDDAPAADFEDLDLQATQDTGLLRGVVVDEAIRPLAGVQVSLTGPEGLSKDLVTKDDGAFGTDGLKPGTYFLTANKTGYRQAQASADVLAGEADPPIVKVLLVADPTQQPFVQAYTFDAFIECSTRTVVIGLAACSTVGVGNDNFTYSYNLDATPDHWQSEMVWESTQAFGSELSLAIDCLSGDPCPDGQVGINRSEGVSPRWVTINRTMADHFLLGAGQPIDVRIFAFGRQDTDLVNDEQTNEQLNSTSGGAVQCVEWPAIFDSCMRFGGIGIIVSQKVTVYSHAFYRYTPDAGWLFIESGQAPPPPA